MTNLRTALAALTLLALCATATHAMDAGALTDGQRSGASIMRVFGPARAPIGHIGFCDHRPSECRPGNALLARPKLTAERWLQLQRVNTHVNSLIEPRTDLAQYGSVEVWTYPEAQGDCEDYVLLKRRMLHSMGWPLESLLITVVRDEFGDGHAILTVRTKQGDFILDNIRKQVKRWSEVPYEFLKRQSFLNPREWVALTPTAKLVRKSSLTFTVNSWGFSN